MKGVCQNYIMAKSIYSNNVFIFIDVFIKNLESLDVSLSVYRPKNSSVIGSKDDSDYETITYSKSDASIILELGQLFLKEFKEFLLRGDFTIYKKNEEFVQAKFDGLSDSSIRELFDFKDTSSVRVQTRRFTEKAYQTVWGKATPPFGLVYLTDKDVVSDSLRKLRAVSVQYSLENMFSFEVLKSLKAYCKPSDDVRYDVTSEEYLKALRFVTTFATITFEDALSDIDPVALDYVLSALARRGNNFTSRCFATVMDDPKGWLYSSDSDFRAMLVESSGSFVDIEDDKPRTRKRKVETDIVSQEITVEPIKPSNSFYDIPISEEFASIVSARLENYNTLKGVNEERYTDIMEAGKNQAKADTVAKFFMETDFETMSSEEFKNSLKVLNAYALSEYVRNKRLKKEPI